MLAKKIIFALAAKFAQAAGVVNREFTQIEPVLRHKEVDPDCIKPCAKPGRDFYDVVKRAGPVETHGRATCHFDFEILPIRRQIGEC